MIGDRIEQGKIPFIKRSRTARTRECDSDRRLRRVIKAPTKFEIDPVVFQKFLIRNGSRVYLVGTVSPAQEILSLFEIEDLFSGRVNRKVLSIESIDKPRLVGIGNCLEDLFPPVEEVEAARPGREQTRKLFEYRLPSRPGYERSGLVHFACKVEKIFIHVRGGDRTFPVRLYINKTNRCKKSNTEWLTRAS